MAFKQVKKLTREELREYAAGLLAGRALSSAELRTRLRKKAAVLGDVEELIASLQEYGALDDAKFAGHYAETRASAGNYGKQRVLANLMGKRVSAETARGAVDEAYAEVDEVAAVEQWLARKYRSQNLHELLKSQSKFASVYRRLRMAGFGSGSALKVLKRIGGATIEAEEIEGEE